jgi:hypothetical protein
MYARINPPDPKRGHRCHRYVFRGFRYESEKGWYKVSDQLAAELKTLVEDTNAPIKVLVFQVATEAEAKELSLKDYEAANPERKITEAIAGAQTVPEAVADEVDDKDLSDKAEKPKPAVRVAAPKATKENPFA